MVQKNSNKIANFEKDIEKTESGRKFVKRKDINETMVMLDKIDKEIEEEKAESIKKIDKIFEEKLTGFINEHHFEGDAEKYKEFLDSYIH